MEGSVRSGPDRATDDEDEDDDDMDMEKNWAKLDGEVIRLHVEQNEYGLGISLAGI